MRPGASLVQIRSFTIARAFCSPMPRLARRGWGVEAHGVGEGGGAAVFEDAEFEPVERVGLEAGEVESGGGGGGVSGVGEVVGGVPEVVGGGGAGVVGPFESGGGRTEDHGVQAEGCEAGVDGDRVADGA